MPFKVAPLAGFGLAGVVACLGCGIVTVGPSSEPPASPTASQEPAPPSAVERRAESAPSAKVSDERRTVGHERIQSQDVDLKQVKPLTLAGRAGDCFVFALRPSASAKLAPLKEQGIFLQLRETSTYILGFELEADESGAATKSHCLAKAGKVSVLIDGRCSVTSGQTSTSVTCNKPVGSGRGTFEVWKKTLSVAELAELTEDQARKKQREAQLDQFYAEQDSRTCESCAQELRSCQTGQSRPSLSNTCAQDFYRCADVIRGRQGKRCY